MIVVPNIDSSYMPTLEGLQMGALRVSVLIAIVSMVAGLLRVLEKDKLVSAIIWLATPLTVLGLNVQRFALLLVLTLDKVLSSETAMRTSLENRQLGKEGVLNAASMVLTGALTRIESKEQQERAVQIELHDISAPPLWQWLFPAVLAIALYLLS